MEEYIQTVPKSIFLTCPLPFQEASDLFRNVVVAAVVVVTAADAVTGTNHLFCCTYKWLLFCAITGFFLEEGRSSFITFLSIC